MTAQSDDTRLIFKLTTMVTSAVHNLRIGTPATLTWR